jgi:hypothetical protein
MAIAIGVLISYDVQDLQTVSVYDASVFTGASSITDINGLRMLFSTVNSVAAAQSNVTEMLAWYEYQVISGTIAINGVTYVAGDLILLANDYTITSTSVQIDATGRYSQYISNVLPLSGLPYVFDPSQTGRSPFNNLYFSDEVFVLNYEQYTTIYSQGDSLIAGQYLCVGVQGESVLINGTKTVYPGEVVTIPVGGVTFTGTPDLVLYSNTAQFYFITKYQSYYIYQAYLQAKAVAINPDEALNYNLLSVAALYYTTTIGTQQTSAIGLNQLQLNLNQIIEYYGPNI